MNSRQKAIEKADKYFSKFIVISSRGQCFTCGMRGKYLDCSHYVTRSKLATRWNIKNAHAMCRDCHHAHHLGDPLYDLAMVALYGQNGVDALISESNALVKLYGRDIEDIADRYLGMIKNLCE
jgi:hypothetical protein